MAAVFAANCPSNTGSSTASRYSLHSIERLAAAVPLQQLHVAVAPGDRWFDEVIGARPGVTVLRCGGATRGETVRNLLSALAGAAGR